jgi:hypothetical protein
MPWRSQRIVVEELKSNNDYWSQLISVQYSNNKGYDFEDRMNWITKLEVGLSEHILKSGLNMPVLMQKRCFF